MKLFKGSAKKPFMKATIVIPARMGSTRFPGKPLALIKGTSLLERVWRIARAVNGVDNIIIATDHQDIADCAEGFGADVAMTSSTCKTGSDRVAEAISGMDNSGAVIFSLQGDSVLTPPWIIEDVLKIMRLEPEAAIATPAVRLSGESLKGFVAEKKKGSTTGTCVVTDLDGFALYFSKTLLPFYRDGNPREILRHIGLYAYRYDTLLKFKDLPQGNLEQVEKLEQLRALENGIKVRVVEVDYRNRTPASVDCPEDITLVEQIIDKEGELLNT